MLKETFAGALMVAIVGSAAYAAGPEPTPVAPVVVAPPPPPFWEGGYVGAQIGYGFGDFDLGDAFDAVTLDDSSNGLVGGITAGYLWSLNNGWYIGPEFQYDWADLDVTDTDTGDNIAFEEMARLKLIAGYEVGGGSGLVYGTAGIAYGSLDNAGDIFDGFDGSDTNWLLGLGYDHRVGQNWTVGGEYMYHDFDDINVNTIHLKATYRF